MAQALEKGNVSPKLRIMGFLHKKRVIFSQNSDFDEILFSQKSLINRKNQPHILPQQVLVQQTPIIFCCYYKPQRSGPHEVRNCREAAVPKKNRLKNRRKGRAATGAHLTKMKAQYQTFQTRYSSFRWYA